MSKVSFRYRRLNNRKHQIVNYWLTAGAVFLAGAILSIVLTYRVQEAVSAEVPVPAAEIVPDPPVPTKTGASPAQNEKIAYAWSLSHDLRFIYTLNGENGLWTHNRRHNPANNARGVDWGLCGVNDYWHPKVVSDPRFLTDWKWQMNECYRLWKGGTKFYGFSAVGIIY